MYEHKGLTNHWYTYEAERENHEEQLSTSMVESESPIGVYLPVVYITSYRL